MTIEGGPSNSLVQVNGIQFQCKVDGPPRAPWIVFSNSLMTNLSLWDEQVAALGNSFRILRYDQRGHGGTASSPGKITFDLLADDAAALLDAFEVERAVFVGVSMGAVTALRMASSHPQRLAGVVACDGQWAAPPGSAELWEQRIQDAMKVGVEVLVEPTVSRWFGPEFVTANSPAIRQVRQMIRDTPVDGFVSCARALQQYDFRDDCAAIRLPVLLLVGAADGSLPQTMRSMHHAMPGSAFVEVAGAGHLPNVERPEAFLRAISPFVQEPSLRSRPAD
jgi:3-oxoadipate enol-lactonase